jgi:hypothetical protein
MVMASPKSVMSVSSTRAEISSEQGSPGSYIERLSDPMECDMNDPYIPDTELAYPDDDTMVSRLFRFRSFSTNMLWVNRNT